MARPHSPTHTSQPGPMTLRRLYQVKQWLKQHKAGNPMEYDLWDMVLTLWMMGWIGWLPAFALGQSWAYPLCVLGLCAPGIYVRLRAHAHHAGWLRCDWLDEALR